MKINILNNVIWNQCREGEMKRKSEKNNMKKGQIVTICLIFIFLLTGCVDYSNPPESTKNTLQTSKNESQANADTVQTNEDESQANADALKTNEDAAQKNEDTSKTTTNTAKTNSDNLTIIATSPATVEICEALDIALAGVPKSDLYQTPECYKEAAYVGSAMSPDMEIISSLNPDWILSPVSLISDLQPKYEEINSEYAFLNLSSVEGMFASISDLGQLFHRENQAKKLLQSYEKYMEEYKKKYTSQGPSVLILMGLPGSYVVATENSYVGNLVKLAGGVNVYQDYEEDFINMNTEDMLIKNPDIILRASHAMPKQVQQMFEEEFLENDVWKHFDAVKNKKVYDLPSGKFGMSATLAYEESLDYLGQLLYQEETANE